MTSKSEMPHTASELPAHRARFQALITANPNHFDNLAGTVFKPKMKLLGDTSYEQLTCVSFNPDLKTLEATLIVKRSVGYGGDLCHAGSREYVRFFVDYGSGPVDAGLASVKVHDIPKGTDCEKASTFPLAYAVSLPFEPKTDSCDRPVLPEVHAILSWQNPPPPNALDPAFRFRPVWGNELKCHIQVKPRGLFLTDVASKLSADVLAKLPDGLVAATGPVPIPLPDPPPLSIGGLATLYGSVGHECAPSEAVPPHRFGMADIASVAAVAGGPAPVLAKVAEWAAAGLDWAGAVQAVEDAKADVTYEEVECVGLDNGANRLVATFRVKRPSGYSGDLCRAGSTEHVAFWADWDDTCELTYLGTATVKVHDIEPLPAGGLCYAAVLPVNLDAHGRSCDEPKVVRVRAVLSWAVPPSTTDPDALTTWGNRKDVHVQVRPGRGSDKPQIGLIGNVPVPQIDVGGFGLTIPAAHFDGMVGGGLVDALGRECPFGGRVILGGTLLDTTSPFLGWTYQIQAGADGSSFPELLTDQFTRTDNSFINHPVDPLPDGFFPFFSFQNNIGGTMAYWNTAGVSTRRYIRLALKDPGGIVTYWPTMPMAVQLDNTAPIADIHIDSGGDCKKFPLGAFLSGHFTAIDPAPAYFGSYTIGVLPDPLPSPPTLPGTSAPSVAPASGTSPTGSAPGDDQWSLDTTGMPDCGYVVRMWAVDRSIVNSVPGQHNWSGEKAVGFSLG